MLMLSKKRIGYISSYLGTEGGGVSQVLLDLQDRVNKRGRYEIHSFGSGNPETIDTTINNGFIHRARLFKCAGLGYIPQMNSELNNNPMSLLHLHGLWMFTSYFTNRQRLKGTPTIVSPHGMLDPWALKHSKWKKKLILNLFEKKNLNNADCVHALTTVEASHIRNISSNVPICVIPNGVNLPIIREVKLQGSKKRLVFISRIHPKKCVEELVRAWILISPKIREEWSLDIYGWGENGHEKSLVDLLNTFGLESNVFYHGPVFGEEKQLVFEHASAFILPSISEGLPMAVLEAWSFGVPVVITDQCNIPEAFSLGCAIRVTQDIDDIACKIREIIEMNSEQLRQMGKNGRLLVESTYSWDIVAEKFERVYDWILGDSSRPQNVQ